MKARFSFGQEHNFYGPADNYAPQSSPGPNAPGFASNVMLQTPRKAGSQSGRCCESGFLVKLTHSSGSQFKQIEVVIAREVSILK